MKRTFILIYALIMLLALSALPFRSAMAEADEDGYIYGTCGDALTWQKTLGGALLITGTGAMYDYEECGPWGTDVTSISFNSGVTSIGANAFNGCDQVTVVSFYATEQMDRHRQERLCGLHAAGVRLVLRRHQQGWPCRAV